MEFNCTNWIYGIIPTTTTAPFSFTSTQTKYLIGRKKITNRLRSSSASSAHFNFGIFNIVTLLLLLGNWNVEAMIDGDATAAMTSGDLNNITQTTYSTGTTKTTAAAAATKTTTTTITPPISLNRGCLYFYSTDVADAAATKLKIDELVKKNKVVCFIKGVPEAPRCGFSNAIVQLFRMHGVSYDSHNVLENEEIRQGVKDFTNWPTIPQIFINGEFIGGCDIMLQMHQNGELIEELKKAGIKSALLEQHEKQPQQTTGNDSEKEK